MERRDPIGFHFRAQREEHLQTERVHDNYFRVVAVAEQSNVVAVGHVIRRHAGVHLREFSALSTLAIDQIPGAHLAVLGGAHEEVIVLDNRGPRQT